MLFVLKIAAEVVGDICRAIYWTGRTIVSGVRYLWAVTFGRLL